MCPCCGDKSWKEVEGYSCYECNYRYIATKELDSCSPKFCEACGCNYSDGCPIHSQDDQKPIKF